MKRREPRLQDVFRVIDAEALQEKLVREAAETVQKGVTIELLLQILRRIQRQGDLRAAELVQRFASPGFELACGRGCSYCCYARVSVCIPEVLLIVAWVRQHFTPGEQADLLDRLRHTEEETTGITDPHHWPFLPCPFLVEGACSVYGHRPFVCRRANSVSKEQCRVAYTEGDGQKGLLYNGAHFHAVDAHRAPFGLFLYLTGLDKSVYNLTGAARIALEDPRAGEKWLNGEPVFRPAWIRDLD